MYPGTPKDRELLVLRDVTPEFDPIAHSQIHGHALKLGPIISLPDDKESAGDVALLEHGKRAENEVDALVPLEAPQVEERGGFEFWVLDSRCVCLKVYTVGDDLDKGGVQSPADQIELRALGYGYDRAASKDPGEGRLENDGSRCSEDACLAEGGSSEEMMDEEYGGGVDPERREEGHFVDIFNHDVEVESAENPLEVPGRSQPECVSTPDPVDFDSICLDDRVATGPPRNQDGDLMAQLRDTPEGLVQMYLGSAGLGVLEVLPIDYENVHVNAFSGAGVGRLEQRIHHPVHEPG